MASASVFSALTSLPARSPGPGPAAGRAGRGGRTGVLEPAGPEVQHRGRRVLTQMAEAPPGVEPALLGPRLPPPPAGSSQLGTGSRPNIYKRQRRRAAGHLASTGHRGPDAAASRPASPPSPLTAVAGSGLPRQPQRDRKSVV